MDANNIREGFDPVGPDYNRRPAGAPPTMPIGAKGGWWGILTGHTQLSANRWSYPWAEGTLNSGGLFVTKTNGKTSSSLGVAYNSIENPNSASGVQGCGINVSNLPTGFALQPIGTGAVVWMQMERDCDSNQVPIFEATNQADGTCSS